MLRMQIVEGPAEANQPIDSFDVGPTGATVGRTDACDWKLDDPNSLISRLHFHVTFEEGEYRLRDNSTNGSFLNGSDTAIGRGLQVTIADGDQVQIGEHVIAFSLVDTPASAAPDLGPLPDLGFAPGQIAASGGDDADTGFSHAAGEAPAAFADVVAAPLGADLLGAGEPPAERKAQIPGVSPLLGDTQQGPSSLDVPVRSPHDGAGLLPPTGGNIIPDDAFDPQDLLNPLPEAAPVQAAPAAAPPSGAGDLIPDDWLSLDPGDPSPAAPQPRAAKPAGPELPPGPTAAVPAAGPAAKPEAPPQEQEAMEPPAAAASDPGAVDRFDSGINGIAPAASAPIQPGAGPQRERSAPTAPADAGAGRPLAGPDSAALRAALKPVLGDDADALATDALLAVVDSLGQMFSIVTPKVMAALAARTQFKDTLRLRQTLIRASENNPLKVSIGGDQALRRLLLNDEPGMLDGVEAMDQALTELAAHQSALLAALKPALRDTLKSLSPASIEKQSGGGKGDRLPLLNRRGKLWEEYCSIHSGLVADDGRGLEQRFLLALATYYEDALASMEP